MILSKAIRPDHCTCEFTKAKQHHTTFVLQPLYFVISPAYRRACYRNEHAASKYIVIAYRLQTPGRNIPMAETRRHSCCTKEENNKKRTTFRCMNSQLVWRETKWTEWIKDCNSEKNRRYNRTSFIFTGQQKRSLFSSEDRARWNGDPACCGKRRDTAREFLNLKKFRIRIQKFWYRSGVGNCNSGLPCGRCDHSAGFCRAGAGRFACTAAGCREVRQAGVAAWSRSFGIAKQRVTWK